MLNLFKRFPLALDISDFSIEVLRLKKKFDRIYMSAYCRVRLEPGIVENGKILNKEKLKEKIRQLFPKTKLKKLKTNEVIFSLPESRIFLHIFKLPTNISDKELPSAVENQALKIIPLEPNKTYFDFQVISRGRFFQEILYVAATKEIVDEYLEVLKEAGLKPLVLDIESASLSRTFKSEKVLDGGMLIIDIGAESTVLTIFDKDSIRISSIVPIGGNHFSKEIAEKLNVSFKEAEGLKRSCGLDEEKEGGRVMFILQDMINDILNEAKGLVRFYEQKKKRGVKKVVLCGGSSLILKIVSYFASNLAIETRLGDPSLICPGLDRIKNESGKLHPVLFSNVVGLALRGLEANPESSGINLIPLGKRPKQPTFIKRDFIKSKIFNTIIILALVLTLIFFGWIVYNYILKPPVVEPVVKEEQLQAEKEEEKELPPKVKIPHSLIPIGDSKVLEIRQGVKLPNIIEQSLKEKMEEGVFIRLLIKDLSKNKFLTLKEFLEGLEIRVPDDFYNNLGSEFTLFVFPQKEGKRLGFVVNSVEKENLEGILRDWEPTMEKTFSNLFLLLGKESPALVPYFKSTSYKKANIRYQTFSRQDLGICYSVFENYFIFTSSFESIKNTLDLLEEE